MSHFHWIIYIFGVFLIYTAVKLAFGGEMEVKPESNPVLRFARRFLPVTEGYEGERFFVRRAGKLWATPLFLVLIVIESTDVVFAVDSIPAVFAVSSHPFVVFTSNVFAILGLRALYFLLAGAIEQFYYLKPALALILGFVGVKMLVSELVEIPISVSLIFIAGTLTIAVLASLIRAKRLGVQKPAVAEPVRVDAEINK